MSDLYRKEALAHRTRALFGEVRLQAPPGTWVVTCLVVLVVLTIIAALFMINVQTEAGALRLIDWLLGQTA